MYARVVRWEGQDPAGMRAAVENIRQQAAAGPPEGVPAVGGSLLIDVDKGTSMAILLFETEDDMRKGHEVQEAAIPRHASGGRRVSVEMFEVAMDIRR